MQNHRLLKIALSGFIIAAGIRFGTSAQFYDEALVSAFFAFALSSVCIIHLRLFPTLPDLAAMLAGTALFPFLDFRLLHFTPRLMAWFSFMGLSSFLILALRLVWAPGDKRRFAFLAFVPSLLFVSSDWFAATFLQWTEKAHPRVLDLYLFVFDASLHVQLPFLLGQAFLHMHWLRVVSILVYISLPIPIAVVYSGHLLKRESCAISAMLAFLVTGPIGIVFYNIFPAMGPAHVFRLEFPLHPLPMETVRRILLQSIPIAGPRNAIPSLHMGWVLLAWWFSRGLSLVERALVLFFVAFTVTSTMGTGEHYLIDLIAAFPFALLVEALCRYEIPWRSRARILSMALGGGLLLAWFAALRLASDAFLASPVLGWSACLLTVGACAAQEATLSRAGVQLVAETVLPPEPAALDSPNPAT
jgi:hypothetical protein